jgi:superfamily I DNA/RNA helicase
MVRAGRYFAQGEPVTDFIGRRKITGDEADILLLVMLHNARRIAQQGGGKRLEANTGLDWLETIKSRYLMQVFVDEATDFSAVELACTIELTHPKLRSWFACGDLRQRITSNGLLRKSELDWLSKTTGSNVALREIDIGYRQSTRLRRLTDALAALDGDVQTTKSPKGSDEADVWPVLGENLSGVEVGRWLAERIHEIERAVGRLPSIAVFVDGDETIEPLVDSARPRLSENSIPIMGCKEGHVVGDASEVRVFDVKHIKGLEFEAAFFVGIDRLSERVPDLFHRIFYVGATRAATYLGLTCEKELPPRLEPVRSHFSTKGWE